MFRLVRRSRALGRKPATGRLAAGVVAAVAAVGALVAPVAALGQSGAPTLREAPDSGFPDKVFIYRTPQRTSLTAANLIVAENGLPVSEVTVDSGAKSSGAILLIDASNSMRGAPIAGAMEAARAFLAERKPSLPVAVIAYNPEVTVLTDFTTAGKTLAASVSSAPTTAEGTAIYDALIRAADLAEEKGLPRTTAVLLSDGHRRGVQASRSEALEALNEANVRVISVGLRSPEYDAETLQSVAQRTGGTYVLSNKPAGLERIFSQIGSQLANEYVVSYRSLLGPEVDAVVTAKAARYPAARATYTTPSLSLGPRGSFDRGWIDSVILSRFLMAFVVVSILALLTFAVLTAFDVRSRSIRRRMAQYVTVPTEEESSIRRAEVASMLADRAQKRVAGQRWWQSFEKDVELAGYAASPVTIAGWTVIGGVLASIVAALVVQSLFGLLVGLAAPVVTRLLVKQKVSKMRKTFGEQLPDNLDVLAGALRAGHSLVGAMNVMVEGADEPSKTEFRRMLQDEQLGVPIDQALMVTAARMENLDIEQVAIVTRLQREAGGNTAEVIDRVVENIRGRMEIRRLIQVLTAQGRLARWVLTALPLVLVGFLMFINPDWLDPLFETNLGRAFLVLWALMLIAGSIVIKRIVEIEV
jgi:tight adherence protein B